MEVLMLVLSVAALVVFWVWLMAWMHPRNYQHYRRKYPVPVAAFVVAFHAHDEGFGATLPLREDRSRDMDADDRPAADRLAEERRKLEAERKRFEEFMEERLRFWRSEG